MHGRGTLGCSDGTSSTACMSLTEYSWRLGTDEKRTLFFSLRIPRTGSFALLVLDGRDPGGVDRVTFVDTSVTVDAGVSKGTGWSKSSGRISRVRSAADEMNLSTFWTFPISLRSTAKSA